MYALFDFLIIRPDMYIYIYLCLPTKTWKNWGKPLGVCSPIDDHWLPRSTGCTTSSRLRLGSWSIYPPWNDGTSGTSTELFQTCFRYDNAEPIGSMYGIYANITGVYWWSMLPYIAYIRILWDWGFHAVTHDFWESGRDFGFWTNAALASSLTRRFWRPHLWNLPEKGGLQWIIRFTMNNISLNS